MIQIYKASMAGPYHIDNGLPCQDSYSIIQTDNLVCAAVADGLGSEEYSDVGSRIASEAATKFCAEHITMDMTFEKIKTVMNNAFVNAYKAVVQEALDAENSEGEYDTTLCLAIYDGSHVYYGQSGDSGMIALLENGLYVKVTEQQRDVEGCVFPLCWGPEKWVFGEIAEPVSGFMLMTDGVFEEICPPVLKGRDVHVNVPLARKFMDRKEQDAESVAGVESAAYTFLENYPRRLLDDDKTVIVVYNPELTAAVREEGYYAVPDWENIYKEANERLNNYPEEKEEGSDTADEKNIESDIESGSNVSGETEEVTAAEPQDIDKKDKKKEERETL